MKYIIISLICIVIVLFHVDKVFCEDNENKREEIINSRGFLQPVDKYEYFGLNVGVGFDYHELNFNGYYRCFFPSALLYLQLQNRIMFSLSFQEELYIGEEKEGPHVSKFNSTLQFFTNHINGLGDFFKLSFEPTYYNEGHFIGSDNLDNYLRLAYTEQSSIILPIALNIWLCGYDKSHNEYIVLRAYCGYKFSMMRDIIKQKQDTNDFFSTIYNNAGYKEVYSNGYIGRISFIVCNNERNQAIVGLEHYQDWHNRKSYVGTDIYKTRYIVWDSYCKSKLFLCKPDFLLLLSYHLKKYCVYCHDIKRHAEFFEIKMFMQLLYEYDIVLD